MGAYVCNRTPLLKGSVKGRRNKFYGRIPFMAEGHSVQLGSMGRCETPQQCPDNNINNSNKNNNNTPRPGNTRLMSSGG